MNEEIDTTNKFLVGVLGDQVVLPKPVPPKLAAADALILAAWLVAMAQCIEPESNFTALLDAVNNT